MRWLPIGGLITVSLVPLIIAGSAMQRELRADFRPTRSIPVRPALLEHDHFEDVSFETGGNTLRGWFSPCANGAAVLLLHGTDADRTQLAPVAHLLADRGYGVLLFDWPGHGASDGKVTWGADERAALTAALDFASRASRVEGARMGVFGFSMGSMVAVQVAARDPRVAALALEGAFADFDEELRHEFRRWGFLSQWPAYWAAHWFGANSGAPRPIDVIADVAPRPVLVIAGTADIIVPPGQSRALFDAAHEPKSWWLVSGATHGHYAAAGGPAYETKLITFFDDALLHK
jgi:pimeloyl-ACP methyl ester carboxylesterase